MKWTELGHHKQIIHMCPLQVQTLHVEQHNGFLGGQTGMICLSSWNKQFRTAQPWRRQWIWCSQIQECIMNGFDGTWIRLKMAKLTLSVRRCFSRRHSRTPAYCLCCWSPTGRTTLPKNMIFTIVSHSLTLQTLFNNTWFRGDIYQFTAALLLGY